MSKFLVVLGSLLLVFGSVVLLFLCSSGFSTLGRTATPGDAGFTITMSLLLMSGVAIVLIIPGLLLLMLGRRRS